MTMRRLLPAALLALAWLGAPSTRAAEGEYKLIVHDDNPATSLTRAEVARMFLKKVAAWPDKKPILPVDQERTSPVRQRFSADVHQKDPDQVSAYWQVLVYSGRDVPPKILKSDEEVVAFVRSNPGGLGYVAAETKLVGVKAVTVR
jgi:ABC-type phosphate transport system substrate-binding protein